MMSSYEAFLRQFFLGENFIRREIEYANRYGLPPMERLRQDLQSLDSGLSNEDLDGLQFILESYSQFASAGMQTQEPRVNPLLIQEVERLQKEIQEEKRKNEEAEQNQIKQRIAQLQQTIEQNAQLRRQAQQQSPQPSQSFYEIADEIRRESIRRNDERNQEMLSSLRKAFEEKKNGID